MYNKCKVKHLHNETTKKKIFIFTIKGGDKMNTKPESLYVDAEYVACLCSIAKPTAYKLIRQLNEQLKKENPRAIVIAGKINKNWLAEACSMSKGDR